MKFPNIMLTKKRDKRTEEATFRIIDIYSINSH